MSGYEKGQNNADINDYSTRPSQNYTSPVDYNTSRPALEPMYFAYALPGLADGELQPTSTAYDRHADQMAYGGSPTYPPRTPYEATNSPYGNFGSRKIPEVSSYSPQRGTTESNVYVYLDSSNDLLVPSPIVATLMFATCRVPAALSRLEPRDYDTCYKFVVTAHAPPFSEIGSSNPRIPLTLQLQESSGLDVGLIDIGPWLFDDSSKATELRSPTEFSRKRKVLEDSLELSRPAKHALLSPGHPANPSDHSSYTYLPVGNLAYPQSLHSVDLTTMQRRLAPYGRSQPQHSVEQFPAPLGTLGYSGSTSSSQPLMRPPATQSTSWNPAYASSSRSPGLNGAPTYQTISSPNHTNPTLVRASILQQQAGSTSASSDGSFNPYVIYPNRAIIKFRGDLNTMTEDWTPEERAAKRRLVRFQGEQTGSTVNTYFKAVRPDERSSPREARERRISCIYWEERQEYFVTSVDTIALLETLVGNRFGVEEKNRIRRNLETHHPLTVSKAKPDTEDFFKVIMGFPNPKPRNIEKDVKVFPWHILVPALKKVISKYSASQASIASPLPTPRVSTYGAAQTENNADRFSHLSRSASNSTASSAYAQTLKSSTMSPPSASSHYSQASPLHVPTASLPQSYTIPVLASQYSNEDEKAYNDQVPTSSLSYAYTGSAIGRRRSSDGTSAFGHSAQYPARPLPNARNSFSSLSIPQESSDHASSQMPSADLPVRSSWDLSAYVKSTSVSANSVSSEAVQYSRESNAHPTDEQRPQMSNESPDSPRATKSPVR